MKLRDVIFWIHLTVGITVGLIVLIMSVTGTMLAFRHEIIGFAERRMQNVAPQTSGAQKLSLAVIIAKAQEVQPQASPSALTLRSSPNASVAVNFGREHVVYVNPYTGDILGQGSKTHDVLEKIEVWHRWLGMEGKLKSLGHNIKGVCTIAFLLMVISGLYLWWPREWNWKTLKMVTTFNPNASGKAKDFNWHNVIGFWCAPLLIIIALTGIIMSYTWANNLLYRMAGNDPPAAQSKEEKKEEKPPQLDLNVIDLAVLKAQEKVPGWVLMNIRFPAKAGAPVSVSIKESGHFNPNPRSQLNIDPVTLETVKWEPFSEQVLGKRLRTWARYLHTGEAGGLIGKTIAFFASLAATLLVWTGTAMAWYRFCIWRSRKI